MPICLTRLLLDRMEALWFVDQTHFLDRRLRHALCSFEGLLRFFEKMRLQRAVNSSLDRSRYDLPRLA